jgi:hypothetical protein
MDIDWIGVLIASACMAMLSYVFCSDYVKHLSNSTCAEHRYSISCRNDHTGLYLPSWTPEASEPPSNHPELDMT